MGLKLYFSFLILILGLSFVLGVEHDQSESRLTSCVDADGDDPFVPGVSEWSYIKTSEKKGDESGGGSSTDECSFHYWYVLRYIGEDIKLGDTILVEGICPSLDVLGAQNGEIRTQKFYKCECGNVGLGGEKETKNFVGYCKDTPEEIPASLVYEAEEQWVRDGRPSPPFMIRLLRFLGWGG